VRSPAASHHVSFQQAFIGWRWPRPGQPKGLGADVAVALERWLAEYPEYAEAVQQLALGAAMNAVVLGEWDDGQRIANAGLDATLLGALASEERLASATLLGLLAARSELGLGNMVAARLMIERALDSLQRMDAYAPLASYLQLQRHLLTGEVAEAALEVLNAMPSYERAVELVTAIAANRRRANELEAAWREVTFGKMPEAQREQSRTLWDSEMRSARRRATLGLARASPRPEAARDAIRLCLDDGLPVEETALALHGVIAKLPRDELDKTIDELISAATPLGERHRNLWVATLRALQAQAWLAHGDTAAAQRAIEAVSSNHLKDVDAIGLALVFAARTRVAIAFASSDQARDLVGIFLSVHAETTERLAETSFQLRLRAAGDSVLAEATRAKISAMQKEPSADVRRQVSVLLDAMRAAETAPPAVGRDSPVQRAVEHASDRIGRLAAAIANRGELAEKLVLIIQSVGDGCVFICVGGDAGEPIAVTSPDAAAQDSLQTLVEAAERAIREGTADLEMEAAGRTAFDALPAAVRGRILRARALIVVLDLAAGQDRVPIELLHDGAGFIGLNKVVARCLSLSHALRVLEAPLVMPLVGRRALCAAVANPPGLSALQFADEEITAVSAALRRSMWNAVAVRESDADARAILELAPLANILHVACHGEATAGAEALVLADGARLSATDIATKHRLRGVVYLNACSLAQGRYLGGGVSRGVAYAFTKAGAPCVIANLLPVEDQGAALLSEAFYREARDHPIGEAMRRARGELRGRMNVALLTASIVIGDPFVTLGGDVELRDDATSRLFDGAPVPKRVPSAQRVRTAARRDPRFAAALEFARGVCDANDAELKALAHVARDIGHDIGEAHCWLALAERQRASSADRAALCETLTRLVQTLEPLRGIWEPAFDAHRNARDELRALEPGYEPRTLKAIRTESGLSINDRSDPAVNTLLGLLEAQQEHETHWRGVPVLRVPDCDAASIAHNAVVWGYLKRVYDTGAEAGLASKFAARASWLGLVRENAVPHLARILSGILRFVWGQQKVTHLEHWMQSAHRDVVAIAIDRVSRYWTPPERSAAASATREIAAALDRMVAAPVGRSKFAQARAALSTTELVAPAIDQTRAQIQASIDRLYAVEAYAAADFGAWVLGELLTRISEATTNGRQEVVLACTSLLETLESRAEDWLMPYLMDGFKAMRETGGQDLLAQWSSAVL
jgi:CHAT domain-containing protein